MSVDLRPLVVSTFPNAKALPLWVGLERGFFERRGLGVIIDETPSSSAQRAKLASGDIDIAQAAVDNALAMILAGQDIVIVMGGENGMNEFIARADIRDFSDFRGRTLVVDAPNTAYALLARKVLSRAGLTLDVDYKIEPIGNGASRLRALLSSDAYAGAVMNPPFSSEALMSGMKSLGRMVDLLGPYQAGGAFLTRAFARDRPKVVEAYIASYVEALHWVVDPANESEAVAMLESKLVLSPDVALATYRQIVDPTFGFTPDAKFDREGFRNVLDTRGATEGRDPRVDDIDAYVDETYYRSAMENLATPRR